MGSDWDEQSSRADTARFRAADIEAARLAQRSVWQRFVDWVRGRPKLPPSSRAWYEHARTLPADLRKKLNALPSDVPPEVERALGEAVEDFAHLRDLVAGDELASSPVDGAALVRDAERVLRRIADSAPAVARGGAPDELQRSTRALHDAASAAIQYAASRADDDAAFLSEHAGKLRALVG